MINLKFHFYISSIDLGSIYYFKNHFLIMDPQIISLFKTVISFLLLILLTYLNFMILLDFSIFLLIIEYLLIFILFQPN